MLWRSCPVAVTQTYVHPLTGASKIDTERWANFLGDIHSESKRFCSNLSQAISDRQRVDSEFKERAQACFNLLYKRDRNRNIEEKSHDPSVQVRRKEPKRDSDESESLDRALSPYYEHLRRPAPRPSIQISRRRSQISAAKRILAPSHLNEVYNVRPKRKDVYVISGKRIRDA
jgi:hypothetical protein